MPFIFGAFGATKVVAKSCNCRSRLLRSAVYIGWRCGAEHAGSRQERASSALPALSNNCRMFLSIKALARARMVKRRIIAVPGSKNTAGLATHSPLDDVQGCGLARTGQSSASSGIEIDLILLSTPPSDSPSVCLSNADTVSTRMDISTHIFDILVKASFWFFSSCAPSQNFKNSAGALNTSEVGFLSNIVIYLRNGTR